MYLSTSKYTGTSTLAYSLLYKLYQSSFSIATLHIFLLILQKTRKRRLCVGVLYCIMHNIFICNGKIKKNQRWNPNKEVGVTKQHRPSRDSVGDRDSIARLCELRNETTQAKQLLYERHISYRSHTSTET